MVLIGQGLTDFDVGVPVEKLEALLEAPEAAVDALEEPAAGFSGSVLESVQEQQRHFRPLIGSRVRQLWQTWLL